MKVNHLQTLKIEKGLTRSRNVRQFWKPGVKSFSDICLNRIHSCIDNSHQHLEEILKKIMIEGWVKCGYPAPSQSFIERSFDQTFEFNKIRNNVEQET